MARKFNRVRESVARTTRSQSQRNLDGASFSVIQFMALVARLARLHSSNEELWVQTTGLTGTWITVLRDFGRIAGRLPDETTLPSGHDLWVQWTQC